jgi:hypothetical protein
MRIVILVIRARRQNIIKVIKFRRMKWAGHVARMIDMADAYTILVEGAEGRDLLAGRDI